MTGSKEIAIRHVARFGGFRGVVLPLSAPLPENTMDPRWLACASHRTACDCREAEFGERINEYRSDEEQAKKVFAEVLAGHQTFAYTATGAVDTVAQCKCSGCEIARRTYFRRPWDVDADREAAGLVERTEVPF
ncbi:hypothetical protein [Herbidospora daliensis]|uniref:hypothetical protein n=1 Tax=Herbidospora daliensis TaxID=295585 RepID=UPI00078306A1|nr:hypothetical protein [Herbidospora daliensis]